MAEICVSPNCLPPPPQIFVPPNRTSQKIYLRVDFGGDRRGLPSPKKNIPISG